MRFSWTGLILAPLAVPVIFSVLFGLLGGGHPILGFLILLVPGCIVSYGTTLLIFLPCLFLLSLWRPLTGLNVCLVGLVLGGAVLVPLTVMAWQSSGADSGPPTENFFIFFVRWMDDPMTAVFPLAGLVTAALYWWIGTQQRRRSALATPNEYSGS